MIENNNNEPYIPKVGDVNGKLDASHISEIGTIITEVTDRAAKSNGHFVQFLQERILKLENKLEQCEKKCSEYTEKQSLLETRVALDCRRKTELYIALCVTTICMSAGSILISITSTTNADSTPLNYVGIALLFLGGVTGIFCPFIEFILDKVRDNRRQ